MMKIIPSYFGEIAVSEGYITQQTLTSCLKLQKKCDPPQLIGNIMKQQGVLDDKQIERILKMQQIYRVKLENEYFCHVTLKKNILTYPQMQEIRKKQNFEATQGNHLSFAAIATKDDYINIEKTREIMQSQEYKYFHQLKGKGKSVVSGYELIGVIAKLKKMAIYKAIQVELDRLVAVKVLFPEFENEEYIRRFFYEAKITACFNHPNLIRIYDKGLENDKYFFAMELVEGKNLADKLVGENRLQVGDALKLMKQIAQALQHIHKTNRIHSEINPKNIMIRDDGVGKLLHLSSCCSIKREKLSLGKMLKMPQYMAPEQTKTGERLDVKTDIYSLGATFYKLLTGQPPVRGKSAEEIRKNITDQKVTPIDEIDFTIPEDLAKIVHRMIRKDPAKRYPEIKNVLFALKKILI